MNQETKNNIKIISLLLVVFIILYFLHVTIGDRFEDQYDNSGYGETQIIFSKDTNSKTLTVTEIYSQGRTLHWPEVIVTNGSATLPYGTIDVGDVITDCEGHLELKWESTGIKICEEDFN